MSLISTKASGIALAAIMMVTLLGTSGSSAAAEHSVTIPFVDISGFAIPVRTPLEPSIQPGSETENTIPPSPESPAVPNIPPASVASSLEQLVATRANDSELTGNLKCLAGAIYFEARSESLEGQLAVGRVIVARTRSGRFPDSYCGVVYQHSQFSFVHGQTMPNINSASPLWQKAVALARIADAGSWQSSAEGALFFHAARIATNWRMTRVAQIDHHIFYR